MFCASLRIFSRRISRLTFLLACTLAFVALAPVTSRAQRGKATLDSDPESRPAFNDFRGVRIGMHNDEARKKLGNPRDKGDDQDFYVFNDTQAVQVFYDKSGAVSAISIDYMNGATGIPTAKEVLGTDADAKPDGALYKMIRYPKAGYWVSYSRTAGSSPTTTITIQKIEH